MMMNNSHEEEDNERDRKRDPLHVANIFGDASAARCCMCTRYSYVTIYGKSYCMVHCPEEV